MANAQVLVLVRSSAALTPDQIRLPIEAAARAAGFTPTQWTFNTQAVQVNPVAAGGGVVSGGPWSGDTVSETIPAAGSRLYFNAFRQNFLNGPDPTAAQQASGGWPFSTAPISAALRALPGVSSVRLSFRSPTNSISWDRGVPDAIALVATAPSANYGALMGLAAVGLLAFVASRGSASRRPAMSGLAKLSTNREGLTWEEWRRVARVSSSTRGAHAAWARGEDPTEWAAR